MMAGYTTAKAQTALVIPDSNEGSAFIGPYGNAARQLQMIIDDTLLTSLVGKNLTSFPSGCRQVQLPVGHRTV